MSTFSKLRVGPKGSSAGAAKLMLMTAPFDATTAATSTLVATLPANSVITNIFAVPGTMTNALDDIDIGKTSGGNEIADAHVVTLTPSEVTLADVIVTGVTTVYAGNGGVSTGADGETAQLIIEYFVQDSRYGVNN